MRRMLLPALMISLLLCACGQTVPQRRLEEWREELNAAKTLHVTALVTASMESEVFSCRLDCTATQEQTVVEVLEPESVAGVRAVADAEGLRLEYEGISLGVGGEENTDSPLMALPQLQQALKTGSVLRSWTEWEGERTLFVRDFYVTDDRTLTVWQDGKTLLPVSAELRSGDRMLLRCEIENFTLE